MGGKQRLRRVPDWKKVENDDDTRRGGGFGGWIGKGGRERWEGGFRRRRRLLLGFFAKTAQLANQLERSWLRRRRRRIALISTVPPFFKLTFEIYVTKEKQRR